MASETRPGPDESAEYYHKYIDLVPEGDIRDVLDQQGEEAAAFLGGISEEASLRRYAPGKWSVRQVVSHIADTERVFAYRSFWFARGFGAPLPGFDQDEAAGTARADERQLGAHVEEFLSVRAASATLYRGLSDEALRTRGVAGGRAFSVRALAYITAGHAAHHLRLIRERYL